MAGATLLLTVGILTGSQDASGRATGGYADSLVFSTGHPDPWEALRRGEIDLYTGDLAPEDQTNITVSEAFGDFYGMLVNPVARSDGRFNPFTIREIREALHWSYDRDFLIEEIAGGLATPMFTAHFDGEPDYARDAGFFVALETRYAYDLSRAKTQVDAAMREVAGAIFDTESGRWLVDGDEIEITIIQPIEDLRFEIGAYVASTIERLGFSPVLDPSNASEALEKVYFSEPKLGRWHLYAEAWNSGGWFQFADTQANFFYNARFGAIERPFEPPSSLQIPCATLAYGLYSTLEERRDLLRACVTEGMRVGQRSFLFVQSELFAANAAISNTALDLFSGPFNPFSLRTTIKNGVPGGTVNVGQAVHSTSTWNAYGGHRDPYSKIQQYVLQDFGTAVHPLLGVGIPLRAEFVVRTAGPANEFEVPTSALAYDTSINLFTNVSEGLASSSYVEFKMNWGWWHHGVRISMDDVVATIAMLSRMASGDLAVNNTANALQIKLIRWGGSFRGFEILDSERIRIWFDTYSPDESLIAARSDVFPAYPWELNHLIAESVLGDGLFLSDLDDDLSMGTVDLAKGATFAHFDPRLATLSAAKTIPASLAPWVSPSEASGRWTALDEWRNPPTGGCVDGPTVWNCNYYVSNGPYVLASYTTVPEGAVYAAKRQGYPLPLDAWDAFGSVRAPDVLPAPQARLIQTFPGTVQFGVSLEGAPYDRLASAAWHIWDPAQEEILHSGKAVRGQRPGLWNAVLTAKQTTLLGPETYELQAVVVGQDSTLSSVGWQSFNIRSLRTAILDAIIPVIDRVLSEFQLTLDEAQAVTEIAMNGAQATRDLADRLLIIAVVAVGLSAAALGVLVIAGRRIKG